MSETRAGSEIADPAAEEAVRALRAELGAGFPRIGLFLFDDVRPESLRRTIARIPKSADDWIDQIVVTCEPNEHPGLQPTIVGGRSLDLRIHRTPRRSGYGGLRKAALEYALGAGLDLAIVMRGDGLHPPEALPTLVHAALAQPDRVVIASRLVERHPDDPGALSLARLAAHYVASGFQNRILGLRLHDYYSTFRIFPVRPLESVPFQLNENDRSFDTQILIQFRALGAEIHEAAVPPVWQEHPPGREGLVEVLRGCATAFDYRLHQLHITRRGPYLVDQGVHYTFKQSETGSHVQIVNAIRPGADVLDLGCSQGLLAKPLAEKNVRVTGVDVGPRERASEHLHAYYRLDLEEPLELPTGRVFDYVVVSDVIEHLRNRTQLLRSVRRYLREDGRLIVSTPNIALWFYRLSLLVGRFAYGPRGVLDETHVHLFTGSTFRREVERAGFHILRQRVTALPFEIVFESTGRSRLVRWMANSYHALARMWPAMFAYQYILEAEIITLDEESTSAGG